MMVKDFIKRLSKNLKPDAEMNFLYISDDGSIEFLSVFDICMSADVDDPKNKNAGGVVLQRKCLVAKSNLEAR